MNAKLQSAKEQIISISEDAIKTALMEFLEKHNLESVTWYQYTPSFNDGDPPEMIAYPTEEQEALFTEDQEREFEEILDHEDMLKHTFGDFVQVTFVADGSYTDEEYYEGY